MHVSSSSSPYTRLHALPLNAVSLSPGFWRQKQTVNRQVSLRGGFQKLREYGNFDNLRLAATSQNGQYRGPVFMDSDVYKWLEAVAYDLNNGPDTELLGMANEIIALLESAQQPDGYLNSYWQLAGPGRRWTDLDSGHELYCGGHLFEAAVAFHRTIGETRLLDIARRFADHILATFGPGKRAAACGHPEIELALVELFRETGEKRYLEQALFFINQRGRGVMGGRDRRFGPSYFQDRVPVREVIGVEGHAVRQLYLASGVTDVYMETGEPALLAASQRLWDDVTNHRMHITGGFGARHVGESFGEAYELPSDRCYCETCATIAAIMWNWRMLLATGEACFADLIERCLYNGLLSGISMDGQRYFYINPLQSRGGIERAEWFDCACCPPNVMRLIAMVQNYVATSDADGMQIHQYMPATVHARLPDGHSIALHIETDYPWDGRISVTVECDEPGLSWPLSVRIPVWCSDATLRVNDGVTRGVSNSRRYVKIHRRWRDGDKIELDLPMRPRLIAPNPRVDAIRGSLAIERGPLVYCIEEVDQSNLDLLDIRIDASVEPEPVWRDDLYGGTMALSAAGKVTSPDVRRGHLYAPITKERPSMHDVNLTAVPYFTWANRGTGTMRVWIPRV